MALARGPNEKAEKARKLYESGMKLVEIASQLNVPDGTVRRWKSTYGWDGEHESERSDTKANVRKEKKNDTSKAIADEVKEVIQNTKLTDKQQLFCIYDIRCFNATKAYQKAYGCDYNNAMICGSQLLRNPKVKDEIFRLKQDKLNREFLSEPDIFQKYMDIAFADITDYVDFGNDTFTDPDTGEKVPYSFVNLKDSKSVDGTLIAEVSKGKDGAKIKLADRMKALDWLSNHMDLATEKQKAEIEALRAKVQEPERDFDLNINIDYGDKDE